jgi:hypothetical protein
MMPVWIRARSPSSITAEPKSMSSTRPSSVIRTLLGQHVAAYAKCRVTVVH